MKTFVHSKVIIASRLLYLFLLTLLFSTPAFAVLTVAAEINPDPVRPSGLVDAQFTIASTASSGNLTLRVLWPQGLSSTTAISNGGGCPVQGCDPGEFLTWNLGNLASGGNLAVGFNVLVSPSVVNGSTIPFQIELLEGGVSRVLFTRSILVQVNSPLALAVDPLTDPAYSVHEKPRFRRMRSQR